MEGEAFAAAFAIFLTAVTLHCRDGVNAGSNTNKHLRLALPSESDESTDRVYEQWLRDSG